MRTEGASYWFGVAIAPKAYLNQHGGASYQVAHDDGAGQVWVYLDPLFRVITDKPPEPGKFPEASLGARSYAKGS